MNWFERDPLLQDAARIVIENDNASASFLQRKMSIGYARAARLLDQLQYLGVVGIADGAAPRKILSRDMAKIETLLKPRKISADEVQKKVLELDIKVNKILSAIKGLSFDLAEEEYKYEVDTDDEFMEKAVELAKEKRGKLTVTEIQGKLNIGYARSARILDELRKMRKTF